MYILAAKGCPVMIWGAGRWWTGAGHWVWMRIDQPVMARLHIWTTPRRHTQTPRRDPHCFAPREANTASNRTAYFVFRSRIQEPELGNTFTKVHQQVPGGLCRPGPSRMLRHAETRANTDKTARSPRLTRSTDLTPQNRQLVPQHHGGRCAHSPHTFGHCTTPSITRSL